MIALVLAAALVCPVPDAEIRLTQAPPRVVHHDHHGRPLRAADREAQAFNTQQYYALMHRVNCGREATIRAAQKAPAS
jgi:hypothetical protein